MRNHSGRRRYTVDEVTSALGTLDMWPGDTAESPRFDGHWKMLSTGHLIFVGRMVQKGNEAASCA